MYRWPALVTKDPGCGVHVMLDIDSDPYTYHVEFLGSPHSHSWVSVKHVDMYGHKDLPDIQNSQSQQMSQATGRGRVRLQSQYLDLKKFTAD